MVQADLWTRVKVVIRKTYMAIYTAIGSVMFRNMLIS
jgi:hypothetical protein